MDQSKAENDLHFSIRHFNSKMAQLTSLESQLNTTASEWSFRDFNRPLAAERSVCETCGQPITSAATIQFLQQSTANKIDALTSQIQRARQEVADAEESKIKAEEAVTALSKESAAQRINLQKEEDLMASRSQNLRDELKSARLEQAEQTSEYSVLVQRSQELSQSKLALSEIQSQLQRLNDSLDAASKFYETCCAEVKSISQTIADIEADRETMTRQISSHRSLVDIFGSKGIQTFVLRNTVKALQYYSQSYLDELSDGSLQLGFEVGQSDNIIKQAKVLGADGTWRTRPLSSLSGGQWRRCLLSLSLGFLDLTSHRGKLRSSLLVLDEPLTHLDSSGRDSVGKLLRKMLINRSGEEGAHFQRHVGGSGLGLSTILVILQDIAAEEIEECFDCIDEVIKSEGESYVVLDKQ